MHRLSLWIKTLAVCVTIQSSLPGQAVAPEDFAVLLDTTWRGELSYMDYTSGEEIMIPVALSVDKVGKQNFKFNFIYPGEEGANSSTLVKIENNGTRFNGQEVVSRKELPDGSIEVITTELGEDNERKAIMIYNYIIGPKFYSSEKSVRYKGAKETFVRNRFTLRPGAIEDE